MNVFMGEAKRRKQTGESSKGGGSLDKLIASNHLPVISESTYKGFWKEVGQIQRQIEKDLRKEKDLVIGDALERKAIFEEGQPIFATFMVDVEQQTRYDIDTSFVHDQYELLRREAGKTGFGELPRLTNHDIYDTSQVFFGFGMEGRHRILDFIEKVNPFHFQMGVRYTREMMLSGAGGKLVSDTLTFGELLYMALNQRVGVDLTRPRIDLNEILAKNYLPHISDKTFKEIDNERGQLNRKLISLGTEEGAKEFRKWYEAERALFMGEQKPLLEFIDYLKAENRPISPSFIFEQYKLLRREAEKAGLVLSTARRPIVEGVFNLMDEVTSKDRDQSMRNRLRIFEFLSKNNINYSKAMERHGLEIGQDEGRMDYSNDTLLASAAMYVALNDKKKKDSQK